jgi:hypothetical protein
MYVVSSCNLINVLAFTVLIHCSNIYIYIVALVAFFKRKDDFFWLLALDF